MNDVEKLVCEDRFLFFYVKMLIYSLNCENRLRNLVISKKSLTFANEIRNK